MYACKFCGKNFNRKYHLDRHHNKKNKCTLTETINENILISLKNVQIAPKNVQIAPKNVQTKNVQNNIQNNEENDVSQIEVAAKHICKYCNKEFSRTYTLNRHIEKNCNKKNTNGIQEEVLNELKDKVKELQDKMIHTKNTITNNTIHNNIHVTHNIINFNDINYDIDKEFIYSCLKNGFTGDIEYLRRVYIHNIPKEYRPIKCLDPSRDKCVVRKNGEWTATTGVDIYRESLKCLVDNYLIVNNNMLEENNIYDDMIDIKDDNNTIIKNYKYIDSSDKDAVADAEDIEEYINTYSDTDNIITSNNSKIDEYIYNLNRITRMMETKNIDKVSKHMNILLK